MGNSWLSLLISSSKIWLGFVYTVHIAELVSDKNVHACTANVLTIKTMDFDHVPNPGIDPPEFLGFFEDKF